MSLPETRLVLKPRLMIIINFARRKIRNIGVINYFVQSSKIRHFLFRIY